MYIYDVCVFDQRCWHSHAKLIVTPFSSLEMKAPDINKIIITDHRLGIVIHLHCTSSSKLAIQVVVFPIVTITCVANNSYYEKKLASIT